MQWQREFSLCINQIDIEAEIRFTYYPADINV